jgi:uncharacterized membrane protein YbhN (UPF0104 family)
VTLLPVEAHLVCVLLVLVDFVARAWRIQLIVQGLGHRLPFWDAFVLNAWGDAACALTPLRLGGEPARLAGMLRSRVPAVAAFLAISLEVLAAWPVVILAAGWLIWRHAPAWWAEAGPRLAAGLLDSWPWLVVVVAASVVTYLYARRVAAPSAHQLRRPIRRVMVYWRRLPVGVLLLSIPLSFLNLATRVAILPVLALTLPDPPPLGPLAVGSFALLYSQLVLPTPSGAGAVELGFVSGAAGELGPAEGWLLLLWRWYTNGVGVVLGLGLAVRLYGWRAVTALARRGRDRH